MGKERYRAPDRTGGRAPVHLLEAFARDHARADTRASCGRLHKAPDVCQAETSARIAQPLPVRDTLIAGIRAPAEAGRQTQRGFENSETGPQMSKTLLASSNAWPARTGQSHRVYAVIHEYGDGPWCIRGRRPSTAGSLMRTQPMDKVVESIRVVKSPADLRSQGRRAPAPRTAPVGMSQGPPGPTPRLGT